jgi:tripartite-type tricarboxylate transporter receptor subunit TctC
VRRLIQLAAVAAALALMNSATPAQAQSAAEFYKGRTIEIGISSTVGGGYDAHARMLARHMGKYIPGHPTIVPKNIEGAGGLRLANLIYNTAPRDGTSIGTIYRATAFEPLFGNKAAQFDATQFSWIGSASSEVSLCVSWHASGIATFNDLLSKELVVAHSGAGADAYQFSRIINGVLGTRMRLIGGYRGGNEMLLAMERGEVGGRCGWSWSSVQATRREWIERKQVNLLTQLALSKHPGMPDVPLVVELAKSDEQRNTSSGSCSRANRSPIRSWSKIAPLRLGRKQCKTRLFRLSEGPFVCLAHVAHVACVPIPYRVVLGCPCASVQHGCNMIPGRLISFQREWAGECASVRFV